MRCPSTLLTDITRADTDRILDLIEDRTDVRAIVAATFDTFRATGDGAICSEPAILLLNLNRFDFGFFDRTESFMLVARPNGFISVIDLLS